MHHIKRKSSNFSCGTVFRFSSLDAFPGKAAQTMVSFPFMMVERILAGMPCSAATLNFLRPLITAWISLPFHRGWALFFFFFGGSTISEQCRTGRRSHEIRTGCWCACNVQRPEERSQRRLCEQEEQESCWEDNWCHLLHDTWKTESNHPPPLFKPGARSAADCWVYCSMVRCSVQPRQIKTRAMTMAPGCYCWHATNNLRDIVGKISWKSHLFPTHYFPVKLCWIGFGGQICFVISGWWEHWTLWVPAEKSKFVSQIMNLVKSGSVRLSFNCMSRLTPM